MARFAKKRSGFRRVFTAGGSKHTHAVYVSTKRQPSKRKYIASLAVLGLFAYGGVSLLSDSEALITDLSTSPIKIISSDNFGAIDFSADLPAEVSVPTDPIALLDLIPVGPVQVSVDKGDTFYNIARRNGLSANQIGNILNDKNAERMLKRVREGDTFEFLISPLGDIEKIRFQPSVEQRLEIAVLQDGSIDVDYTKIELERRVLYASAKLADGSIYTSAKQAGLSSRVVSNMARVFRYDIDFTSDIVAGDEFAVVYEGYFDDKGSLVRSGDILAAEYVNRGKTYDAYLYESSNAVEYYSGSGRRLKKSFMRNPVDSVRITSRFNPGRKHPVLHKIRAHKGVDYGAPRGTPIYATASGKISFKGRQRGYGNVVKISHANGYVTLYAHMHKFGKIKVGDVVRQGKLIGYVGSTGLATGPHLHYETIKNGKHIDPLKLTSLGNDKLGGNSLKRFKSSTSEYRRLLAKAKTEPAKIASN